MCPSPTIRHSSHFVSSRLTSPHLTSFHVRYGYYGARLSRRIRPSTRPPAVRSEKGLLVREDPSKGVVVEGLKTFRVETYEDVERLLEEGLANRTVGSTAMNAQSSRSHSCFTLDIIQKTAKSRLTLIDLAGSENIKSAETVGERMKEGININKSLSCLGACIGALSKLAAKKDKAAAEMEDAIAALPVSDEGREGGREEGRKALLFNECFFMLF